MEIKQVSALHARSKQATDSALPLASRDGRFLPQRADEHPFRYSSCRGRTRLSSVQRRDPLRPSANDHRVRFVSPPLFPSSQVSIFGSYIQSRGRARPEASEFIVMAERDSLEANVYREYVAKEPILEQMCA